MRLPFIKSLFVAITALVVSTPAHAGFFSLTINETGGPTIPIGDNGSLDTDPSIGLISVNTGLLNLLLVQFQFVTLGATSNAASGSSPTGAAALSQTGQVNRIGPSGVTSISVTATDNDFLFPAGNPKSMSTSASDTFLFTAAGNSRTFQSGFDPGNAPGTFTNQSPLLAFIPPVGVGLFSSSNPGVSTPLGAQPTPFSLTNTTVITLGPSTASAQLSSDQFNGATVVTAPVPEPSTLVLGLLGLVSMAFVVRRSR